MQTFTLQMPTKVIFGVGVTDQVVTEVAHFGKKVFMVTGKTTPKRGRLIWDLMAQLQQKGLEVALYDQIEPNPRVRTVDLGAEAARKMGADVILAVGGGSPMDAAKAIAAITKMGGSAQDIVRANPHRKPIEQALPVIVVPTLAATGSELNGGGVLTNDKTTEKSGFGSPLVYPKVAIIDPSLTTSVSPRSTVDGGVDMFVHLIEAYLTGPNDADVADRLTEGLMKSVIDHLAIVYKDGQNLDARSTLSWTAALALSGLPHAGRSGAFPIHAIEHPVSAHFDIAHGRGLAIILPAYMQYTYKHSLPRFSKLARRVFDVEAQADEEAAVLGIERLIAWLKSVDAYNGLAEVGVDRSALPQIAGDCLRVSGVEGKLQGPNVLLSEEDVLHILENAYQVH